MNSTVLAIVVVVVVVCLALGWIDMQLALG